MVAMQTFLFGSVLNKGLCMLIACGQHGIEILEA